MGGGPHSGGRIEIFLEEHPRAHSTCSCGRHFKMGEYVPPVIVKLPLHAFVVST